MVTKNHYKSLFVGNEHFEPIALINGYNINFNMGNVLKYIARHGLKDGESPYSDLMKAIDYMDFEVKRLESYLLTLIASDNSRYTSLLKSAFNPSSTCLNFGHGDTTMYDFYKEKVFASKPYNHQELDFCAGMIMYCCLYVPGNVHYMSKSWLEDTIDRLYMFKSELETLAKKYYENA